MSFREALQTFRGCLFMIREGARRVDPFGHLAASDVVVRLPDVRHGCGVADDIQDLFEGGDILVPDQYSGWSAVAGDNEALVLPLGSVDEAGQWSRTVHRAPQSWPPVLHAIAGAPSVSAAW